MDTHRPNADKTADSTGSGVLWTRDFILTSLSNLALFLAFQMLMPTLPVYVKTLGGNETMAGIVVGVFTVAAVLTRPLAGAGLDMYGRRGWLLAGLGIFILCVLGYEWSRVIAALLAVRFVHGIGWGVAGTALGTVATDVIPPERLGGGMAYFGLSSVLAMAIAPALGLYLIHAFSFTALFIVSASLAALSFLLALPIRYRRAESRASRGRISVLERTALLPSLVIFGATMTYGTIVSFLALFSTALRVGHVGLFFTVYAAAVLASRPFVGRFTDSKGFSIVIIPGLAGIVAAVFGLSVAHSLAALIVIAALYGLGFGAVQPSLQALAVREVRPDRRGAANGTFMTAFDLGIAAGSVLGGAIASRLGFARMYALAAIPGLLALAVYVFLGRSRTGAATR